MKLRKIIEWDIKTEKQLNQAMHTLIDDPMKRRRLRKIKKVFIEEFEGEVVNKHLPLVVKTTTFELSK